MCSAALRVGSLSSLVDFSILVVGLRCHYVAHGLSRNMLGLRSPVALNDLPMAKSMAAMDLRRTDFRRPCDVTRALTRVAVSSLTAAARSVGP